MHALSFHTWVIHISSVIEWMLAMGAVLVWGERRGESEWRWLALAMVPALASALCACTWHVYDNDPQLHWLVTVQAGLTLLGNCCFAAAAWQIWRTSASAQSR
jgi:peptidoglycan/LPS O-acetylase OafA/YrhL